MYTRVRRTLLAVLLILATVPVVPTATASAVVVATTDITGDGFADLVVRQNNRLYYDVNSGQSGNPWTRRVDTQTFNWDIVRILLLADVTGDGHPDLVTIRNDNTLYFYPHNGKSGDAANWGAPQTTGQFGWNIADWVGLADLTGDGRPDLVARYVADGSLWVYPHNGQNNEDANWTAPFSIGTNWGGAPALLLGDVTADGRTDLIGRNSAGDLTVYVAGSGARIAAGTGWNLANVMQLRDVTGDGHPDIFVRDQDGSGWIYPNNGKTDSNPWTEPRYPAGTGWNLASALVL